MAIISGSPTNGDDTIIANGANDTINALAGNDTVGGGGGNDTLIGGLDNDALYGGSGNDLVIGAKGNDRMVGGTGNDVLAWADGDGSDRISGNHGIDTVAVQGSLAQGDSFVLGQQGNQAIFDRVNLVPFKLTVDTAEQFSVSGVGGHDRFDVNNLANTAVNLVTFYGGAGNDTLDGSDTSTQLIAGGQAGNDALTGGSANDALYGGSGNDFIEGERGNDRMVGGTGNDVLAWDDGDGSDRISGNHGIDTVAVQGSLAQGDSFVLGQQGTQAIFDRVNLIPFKLTVDTAEVFAVEGVGGHDHFDVNNLANTDVNWVTFSGGAGNDTFDGSDTSARLIASGGSGNDTLIGGSANDALYGGVGDDVLFGGFGNDSLTGGGGEDRFRYSTPNMRIDTITDFVAADDSIEVLASGFGGGLTAGSAISAGQFSLGSSAGDANDRFIYNDNNGVLFFDRDGLGGVAQVQLATLTGAPTLAAADIVVV